MPDFWTGFPEVWRSKAVGLSGRHVQCTGCTTAGAAEPLLILMKFPTQLADPCWTQPKLSSHISRVLADHQIVDQPAIPLRARRQPGRKFLPKCYLVRHRRLRVVVQRFIELIAVQRAVIV